MFTGIVQGLCRVERVLESKKGSALRLSVNLGKLAKGLKVGDSVAINGTCLTVVELKKGKAIFELVGETVSRTDLGVLKKGDMVNVERSLKIGDTLDGHFVLGHVDSVGIIEEKKDEGNQTKVWIKMDRDLIRYVAPKGSIAVDGVSLTVVDVQEDRFSVVLIPHTLKVTTLGIKKVGDRVNIEVDVLSRYTERLMTLPQN